MTEEDRTETEQDLDHIFDLLLTKKCIIMLRETAGVVGMPIELQCGLDGETRDMYVAKMAVEAYRFAFPLPTNKNMRLADPRPWYALIPTDHGTLLSLTADGIFTFIGVLVKLRQMSLACLKLRNDYGEELFKEAEELLSHIDRMGNGEGYVVTALDGQKLTVTAMSKDEKEGRIQAVVFGPDDIKEAA